MPSLNCELHACSVFWQRTIRQHLTLSRSIHTGCHVYIKRLCEKIEEGSANPLIILTVHGAGYRLGGGNAPE